METKKTLKVINKTIDLLETKYNTLTSFFFEITLPARPASRWREAEAEKEISVPTARNLYTDMINTIHDIRTNERKLIKLLEDLIEKSYKNLTGKDIDKIVKKIKKLIQGSIKPFYDVVGWRDNRHPQDSTKIELPHVGATPMIRNIKEFIYDMHSEQYILIQIIKDLEKLGQMKGMGLNIEASEMPIRYT